MTTLLIKAAYASVVEDDEDGMLFIGFAEGEDDDEPYALFRQALAGGPVWFSVNDEDFGAYDALDRVQHTAKGLEITLRPEAAASFGWAAAVSIRIGPQTEDADIALAALADMLGDLLTSDG